jgi:2'-5' RNA ligase
MKNAVIGIPGYQSSEYLLVLSPHEELRNKISQVKQQFADAYQNKTALADKPYLLLAAFRQYVMMEERIINRLHAIAMGFQPCKIEMKDYGSFPSHTIFINITSKIPLQHLVRTIRAEAQQLMKFDKEHTPHFILEPHISIGRKLQPWQFEKGWLEYQHRHFTGRFIADAMLLLKRQHPGSSYQIVRRFEFENLPVSTKQGTLFS